MKPITIELEGIRDRKVRLTPNSSALSDAVLSNVGEKLYYLAAFEKGADLWQYEIRTREAKILNKMGDGWAHSLTWDKDGKQLFYMNNGAINRYDIEKNENKGVGIIPRVIFYSKKSIQHRISLKRVYFNFKFINTLIIFTFSIIPHSLHMEIILSIRLYLEQG